MGLKRVSYSFVDDISVSVRRGADTLGNYYLCVFSCKLHASFSGLPYDVYAKFLSQGRLIK